MVHLLLPAVWRFIPILVLGHILLCCLVTMLLLTLVSTLQPVMSWWLALVLWQQILSIQHTMLVLRSATIPVARQYSLLRRRQARRHTSPIALSVMGHLLRPSIQR